MTSLILFILFLINTTNSFTLFNKINYKTVSTITSDAKNNAEIITSTQEQLAASTLNLSRYDVEYVIQELKSLCLSYPLNNVRIESFINFLESKFSPILTTYFLNFALCGEWNLLYSNVVTKNKNLEFNITQMLTPTTLDSFNGSLVNKIVWRLKHSTEIVGTGDLIVKSNYTITPKGNLEVRLNEHVLLPVIFPDDIESLVLSIQRSVPIELFDPDGTTFYNTFVHPELKITRVVGSKWSKINVFVK